MKNIKVKAAPSFEKSGINNGSTEGDRPEDLNPRYQRRGNLKRRTNSFQGPFSASPNVDGAASHLSVFVKYIPLKQMRPFSKILQTMRHGNNIF